MVPSRKTCPASRPRPIMIDCGESLLNPEFKRRTPMHELHIWIRVAANRTLLSGTVLGIF
jgi:hypothetical protein